MYFYARQGIVNPYPCLFQSFSPFKVGSFIKTGFNFHKSRDLFATLHRLHERFQDAAAFCHSVLNNFDVGNRRVPRRFFKKLNDWFKGLVRNVNQLVGLRNGFKYIGRIRQYGMRKHGQWLVFQVFKSEIRKAEKIKIVVITAFGKHIVFAQIERVLQIRKQVLRHIPVVHKTAGGTNLTLLQARFYLLHQVSTELVFNVQFSIAGKFDGVSVLYIVPWKET